MAALIHSAVYNKEYCGYDRRYGYRIVFTGRKQFCK